MVGETIGRVVLLKLWLISIKYPNQIILCDTNTVILLITVIIVETYFYLSQSNLSGITVTQKIPIGGLVKF